MLRIKAVLATGIVLGLTSLTASAGELSFESRGYGGPLYIGPNFQQGGQHSPPIYGSGSGSSSYGSRARSHHDDSDDRPARRTAKKKVVPREDDTAEKKAAPASKATETKAAETENSSITATVSKPSTPDAASDKLTRKADTENSSITTAARTDTAEAASSTASKPVAAKDEISAGSGGCRRFVAAVGAVISVPCD